MNEERPKMDAMLRLLSVGGVLCAALLGAGFLRGDAAYACISFSQYSIREGVPVLVRPTVAARVADGHVVVVGRVSDETVNETDPRRMYSKSASPVLSSSGASRVSRGELYDSTVEVHAVLAGSVDESTLHFTGLGYYDGVSCTPPSRLKVGARVLLVLLPPLSDGGGVLGDWTAFGNSEAGVLDVAYFFEDGDAFFIRRGGEPFRWSHAGALIGDWGAAAQSDPEEITRALLTALGEAGDEGVALLAALDEGGDGGRHRLFWPVTGVGLGLLAISAGGLLMGWRRRANL